MTIEAHPWNSAYEIFHGEVMPELEKIGKTIGASAQAGNAHAIEVVRCYSMLRKSFDPMTLILLDNALKKLQGDRMKLISIFDIETQSAPLEVLAKVKPVFVADKRLKDPIKIAEDIAAKELEWMERAALDATTGQVLCISISDGLDSFDVIHAGDERGNIERFWNWLELRLARSETVAGFNIFGFDLPFLYRRSWILGVEIPRMIRKGRYWHDDLCDVMDVWKVGVYDQRISLDTLSKSLGIGAKTGNGAEFAALWASDRNKALEYCKQDLLLTRKCAERLLGLK